MLNSPMTSFFSFGERASISKFRIFLATVLTVTFFSDGLKAQSTDPKAQNLSTEFLTYITASDNACSGNNPFEDAGKISSTRDANGNVQTTYGEKSGCANAYMPTFCAASQAHLNASISALKAALSSLQPNNLTISTFRNCEASRLKTVAEACENIKSDTKCGALKVAGQSSLCPAANDLTKSELNDIISQAKEEYSNAKKDVLDNNRKIVELKSKNQELTLQLQALPQMTQNTLKALDAKFEGEIAKIDADSAKALDSYQDQIESINKENINLVAELKKTELQAAQEVNKTTADCKAAAAKTFGGLESGKQALVSQRNYKTSGIGGVLGGNKRFKAMLKTLEKQCLESDTYLEAIKMIQAQKQVALDTLKENQKLINAKFDRIQKLIVQAQDQVSKAKKLMLDTKNNEIEKAQLAMNQSLASMQNEITQNDAEIKRIEESLSDIKEEVDENQVKVFVAECQAKCTAPSDSSGGKSNYAKALDLLNETQTTCANVQSAIDTTSSWVSGGSNADLWKNRLKACTAGNSTCSQIGVNGTAPTSGPTSGSPSGTSSSDGERKP